MTDRRQLHPSPADEAVLRACLLAQLRYAVDAGIDVVQIRDRNLEARRLTTLVAEVMDFARGTATRVLVNDRVDVALAAGADGVHLRSDSVPAAAVRSIVRSGFIIGRSIHTEAEARAAGETVDYLLAGTIWPSPSKADERRLLGVDGLARIVAAARVPVVAIGGVSVDRVREVGRTGAAGVAGIGLFLAPAESDRRGCRATPLVALARSARETFGIT